MLGSERSISISGALCQVFVCGKHTLQTLKKSHIIKAIIKQKTNNCSKKERKKEEEKNDSQRQKIQEQRHKISNLEINKPKETKPDWMDIDQKIIFNIDFYLIYSPIHYFS